MGCSKGSPALLFKGYYFLTAHFSPSIPCLILSSRPLPQNSQQVQLLNNDLATLDCQCQRATLFQFYFLSPLSNKAAETGIQSKALRHCCCCFLHKQSFSKHLLLNAYSSIFFLSPAGTFCDTASCEKKSSYFCTFSTSIFCSNKPLSLLYNHGRRCAVWAPPPALPSLRRFSVKCKSRLISCESPPLFPFRANSRKCFKKRAEESALRPSAAAKKKHPPVQVDGNVPGVSASDSPFLPISR